MIHKRLKVLILSAAFLGLPGVQAFKWSPAGDFVGADGFAYDSGNVYNEGDRIISTTPSSGGGGETGAETTVMRKPRYQKSKLFRDGKRVMSRLKYASRSETEVTPTAVGVTGNNTQFEATVADSVLDIYGTLNGVEGGAACSLKIDGDIVLKAASADMTVNINSDVTLVPYIDPTGDAHGLGGSFSGSGYAQVYFDTAVGHRIDVNLAHNLEFKGRTLAPTAGGFEPLDMFLSFHGGGEVSFNMADGTAIKFNGDIDDTFKVDMLNRNTDLLKETAKDVSIQGVSNNGAGTKVLICMDQTKSDLDMGINKVIFRRKNFANEAQRNMVYVGPNSGIFYVSDDATGKAHELEPALGGFGAVAFDVSNKGTGRTVLFLRGARTFGWDVTDSNGNPLYASTDKEFKEVSSRYLFNDAAFVVAGQKVGSFEPAALRTTLNYSVPAGGQAVFRVTDNLAYANRLDGEAFDPSAADRRGLLVINDTETIAKLAADTYWDFFNVKATNGGESGEETSLRGTKNHTGAIRKAVAQGLKIHRGSTISRGQESESEFGSFTKYGHEWSYSVGISDQVNLKNVRTGFIVGVNGQLDVYHNTFLDYVGGTGNRVDDLAANDFQEVKDASKSLSVIAQHNPSALVFDGLDHKLFETSLSAFEAANPDVTANPRHAEVILRGNGAVVMRSAASAGKGYLEKFWQIAAPGQTGTTALRKAFSKNMSKKAMRSFEKMRSTSEESGATAAINPIDIATLDWDAILALGDAAFDGYRLTDIIDQTKESGFQVMDVEGLVNVRSLANTSIGDASTGAARQYKSEVSNAGSISMASIAIDYTGAEFRARPLVVNQKYVRYNSPVMYINDVLELENTQLVHSDVTKLVDGLPGHSTPAICGGERLFFSDALWTFDGTHHSMRYRIPELRLYNAELALQESLNMSGVRLVVTDRHGVAGQAGNNLSAVRFFDHGQNADTKLTGYGRLLTLGSYKNTMANGTTNWATEGTYINTFKQNDRTTVEGDFSGTVRLGLTVGDQFPSTITSDQFEAERGLHLVLLSSMVNGGTNVTAGWPTVKGDLTGNSFPYASTRYGNNQLAEVLSSTQADQFSVDALSVPASAIVADKGLIGFGGFDNNGMGPRLPVSTMNAQSVVHVNHGGKISITDAQLVLDTMVVQRLWNDYNFAGDARVTQLTGIVDLPHDQSSFTKNGGVQVAGLTKAMLDARASETDGYVRVSFDNPDRPLADKSGAQEVVLNWFNTEENAAVLAHPTRALAAKSKGLTRKPSRLTTAIDAPMAKPARLLYIGAGDDIRQLRVAGATQANRFEIEVSGDDTTRAFGRVREFANADSMNDLNADYRIGEGAHAIIFGVLGGRFGLGTTNWNDHSVNPWNILGKDFVQLAVEGDCVADVNSDLIIADSQALVAVESFGQAGVERITFTAESPREIRIPAGMELDLSSFGQSQNQQQIAFGGKVKLVLESGATIRGPRSAKGGVVLYFNDESQFVIESPSDRASGNKLYNGKANVERCKFIGDFQIWLNKSARMSVGDGTLLGVQADASTPKTNVVVSLNRQSRLDIGSSVVAGGAFEVGNPVSVPSASIKFSLASRHVDSVFHIDRQGFFGLGAGVREKQANMNGAATAANNPELTDGVATLNNGVPAFNPDKVNAWVVAPLFDVESIDVTLKAGNFEHGNIADGSDTNAALLAIGQAAAYSFKLNGAGQSLIKGGGNIMLVPAAATDGIKVNLWDFAGAFPDGSQYQLLGAGQQILNGDTASTPYNAGKAYSFTSAADFFNALALPDYTAQANKLLPFARVNGVDVAAAVNLDAGNSKYPADARIVLRLPVNAVLNGLVASGLAVGLALGIESDDLGPTSFGIPVA
jgi:hypothetical protein